MQKHYFLIPVGIVLMVVGQYIVYYSLIDVIPRKLSWMEQQNLLLSTDYPFGTGLFAVGVTCIIIFVVIWKRKSSQKKR